MNVRVIFHYQDPSGAPLAGVSLSATSANGPWQGVTNAAGDFDTGDPAQGLGLGPGDYIITASKAGFVTDNYNGQPVHILFPGTINRALQQSVSSLGALGRWITVRDKRTPFIGIDGFLDFRMFLDGRDLTPFFTEAVNLGFNGRRVWFMGAISQNTVMQLDPREPSFYDRVRAYVQAANAAGLIIFGDIFVDNQVIGMGYNHASKMADLVRGTDFIFSGGNEASKNGFERAKVPNPQMPLWTAGSEQQNGLPEVSTGATVMTFHGVRQWPTSIRDAVASPTEIYDVKGFPNIPLIFDEMVKMGPDGSDRCDQPEVCFRFGRHWGAEGAGVVFHNFRAQRGQLLTDADKRCADGLVRGMRL